MQTRFARLLAPVMFLALGACDIGLEPLDPGPGGPGDDEFDEEDACGQVDPVNLLETSPPDLLLVVDKSGSMDDDLDNGDQKWAVMRDALTTIVTDYQIGVNFGLVLYPNGDECGPGTVNAGIGPVNGAPISAALAAVDPNGNTPTPTTLDTALQYYQGISVNPNGRFVLLATDGQPNCDPADPGTETVAQSIAAIQNLRAASIPTYVLGFGSNVNADPATLQAMAQAGGTMQFYAANSPAELQAALEQIAGDVAVPSCTFELAELPPDVDRLAAYFDDVPVPRSASHADGWDYDAATNAVTFYGSTCDELKSGLVGEVRIDWGCEGPIVL